MSFVYGRESGKINADDVRKKGKRYDSYEDLELYQVGDRLYLITEEGEVKGGHWPEDP